MSDSKDKNIKNGKEGVNKRSKVGVVVSDKMDKTVVVKVETLKIHPKYKKRYQTSKKYKAHDKDNKYRIGDRVVIEETRPLSREKKWKVIGLKTKEVK